ncbi:MAG: M20/M25/M40 family metallo-hydrolase [Oscillospiraceae bacterium]|jgi:carboxypeptidase PM20D1|nr:M20/M25/M40 family metallo-hydrolase [Oscillospiraceae bacterium]
MPYLLYAAWGLAAVLAAAALVFFGRTARIKRVRAEPVRARVASTELSRRTAESLSALIQFRTVSANVQDEYTEWVRLRDHLRKRYPRVHEAMERETISLYSLLYRWPAKEAKGDPLLFCAHIDVVPAEEGWQHPPFAGDIADGYVWGRGALDCKNVMTCLLEAAEALLAIGFQPDRDIYFAFGHDEETGGQEGAVTMAKLFALRNLRFALVLDEGTALKRGLLSLRRPVAEVGVSEKGFMNVRLTTQSAGGHASKPPRHTALGYLSEAICRVEFKPRPPRLTPLIHDLLKALAPYLPYAWRFAIANRFSLARRLSSRESAWVRTTMAPTMASAGKAANVLPGKAEATLNIRLLHGETGEDILRYLRDLFTGLGVSVLAMTMSDPSKVSDYTGDTFRALTASTRRVFGAVPVVPSLMVGGTDARKYEHYSDCVYRFMPFVVSEADMAGVHGVDERVSVEALGLAVVFYGDLIQRLAGPAGRPGEPQDLGTVLM